jgi:hypothetical protein
MTNTSVQNADLQEVRAIKVSLDYSFPLQPSDCSETKEFVQLCGRNRSLVRPNPLAAHFRKQAVLADVADYVPKEIVDAGQWRPAQVVKVN